MTIGVLSRFQGQPDSSQPIPLRPSDYTELGTLRRSRWVRWNRGKSELRVLDDLWPASKVPNGPCLEETDDLGRQMYRGVEVHPVGTFAGLSEAQPKAVQRPTRALAPVDLIGRCDQLKVRGEFGASHARERAEILQLLKRRYGVSLVTIGGESVIATPGGMRSWQVDLAVAAARPILAGEPCVGCGKAATHTVPSLSGRVVGWCGGTRCVKEA